jgi:hypothetical protein
VIAQRRRQVTNDVRHTANLATAKRAVLGSY